MENVESPSKSSPMNLSTRPIERNVLKEFNNLDGGTKSSKQVSATDNTETQLKDSTNLSNNLPDIVTNVHADGNKVLNKNLLCVATPLDVPSDDEYVDCDTSFKNNLSGLALNKTIEKVPNLLDETIQIGPTPNEPEENSYTKKEQSENITENQLMNEDNKAVGSTGNCKSEPSVSEQDPIEISHSLNENQNILGADHPLSIEDVEQTKLSIFSETDFKMPVIEPSSDVVNSGVLGPQNNLLRTPPLTEQINANFTGNLTNTFSTLSDTDGYITCLENTPIDLINNEVNQTQSNPGLPNNREVKQHRDLKINQTVSVDSPEFDCENRDCLLDSLEMKEPIKLEQQTTPAEKLLSNSVGDAIFARKQSPNLSEMFSNSNYTTSEFPNEKCTDLSSMFPETNETTYKDARFSLSRQDAVYISPITDSTERVVRRDTFDVPIPVGHNKITELEELPKSDIPVNNELDQDTLFVASPLTPHQDNVEIINEINELPQDFSSSKCLAGDKIDSTNTLKRRCTYNVMSAEEELPNVDMPASNELNEPRSSLPRQETFSISTPLSEGLSHAMGLNGKSIQLREEVNVDTVMQSTDHLPRQDTFTVSSLAVSHQKDSQITSELTNIPTEKCSNECLERSSTYNGSSPVADNKSTLLSEELPKDNPLTDNKTTNNVPRQDTFTVSSLVVSPRKKLEIISDLTDRPIEESSNKCLERSSTYNVSSPVAADKSTLLLEVLGNAKSDQSDFQFKSPSLPTSFAKTANKADSDNNFMVLSSNDFDFLQSRGTNCDPVDDRRSSLLLRFDPLSRRTVHKPILGVTSEIGETSVGIENNLQEADPNILCGNSSGGNSSDEQQSSNTISLATNATEMSVSLVHDSNNMENETNSTDDKHIAVDGVPLSDKKIKFKYSDGNIQKKMEEYEATQDILVKRLAEKDKTLSKNCAIIEAYEKALAELVAETEMLTANYEVINEKIRNERDLHHQHLMSLETTFSDLHMKYEKSKELIVKLQERLALLNEDKATIDELLKQQEIRYEKMKQHALQQLEYANSTLEKQEKDSQRENSTLKAVLKLEEVSRNTIQEQLLQKCKENEELVKICDELIGGGQKS